LEEYRLESNPARMFIAEHLSEATGGCVPCRTVYRHYEAWSKENGFDALNSNLFGKELRKQFASITRKRATMQGPRQWCYLGVTQQAQVT
jgi:phage/plasmid-associated DNA primase